MTKQITMEETLAIVANIPTEVPAKIAEKIVQKATKDSVQNIGGFPITDPLLVKDRLNASKANRIAAIDLFNADKEILKTKLLNYGINNYLAIIPTSYWKNLCDRHNLLTVNPDLQGKVQINTHVPYTITEKAKHFWNIAQRFLVASSALASVFTIGAYFNNVSKEVLSITGSAALALCFMAWLTHYTGENQGKNAIRKHLRKTSYAKLIQDITAPQYNYIWSSGASAQLILPEPPIDVVLLLRKLRDHRTAFTVTADPQAMQFSPSVEDLYLRGHGIEVRRIAQERLDPIITISHNNATAVLAQFGDFKWELEVIEEILSTVILPTR